MPLDSYKIADRLKKKVADEKKAAPASEPDGDEEMTPGRMALKAIKAGDPEALEEAIRECVRTKY